MLHNIGWALKILRSRTLVVLTDKEAYCNIPYLEVKKFDDIVLLAGQQAALATILHNLEKLLEAHERQSEALVAATGQTLKPTKKKK